MYQEIKTKIINRSLTSIACFIGYIAIALFFNGLYSNTEFFKPDSQTIASHVQHNSNIDNFQFDSTKRSPNFQTRIFEKHDEKKEKIDLKSLYFELPTYGHDLLEAAQIFDFKAFSSSYHERKTIPFYVLTNSRKNFLV